MKKDLKLFFSLRFFVYICFMKNLATQLRQGKSLSDIEESKADRNAAWYGSRKSNWHDVDGVSVNKRIERICEAFQGKQFSKAFAEYCKQVPVYQQKFFLEEFEPKSYNKSGYWDYWFVDKQGNIKKFKGTRSQRKKKVYYYSDDYKTELRHKVSGEPKPEFFWMLKNKRYREEDFVQTVVAGFVREFSSGKDPEFMRLVADQKKRKAKEARLREKESAAKSYSFISKTEKEIEKEKAKDKVKIEAKGFDYETSFRNEKQTNPDTIKERQTLKPKK
jgi:hypothetical protein